MSYRPATIWASAAVLACALSCAANPAAKQTDREKIIQRAGQSFERAVLFKPKDSGLTGTEYTFAPLIVEEMAPAAETKPAAAKPGLGEIPEVTVVYHSSCVADIGREKFNQIEYVWMPGPSSPKEPNTCANYRGLRITLDHDGYPLVWEALSGEAGPHLIFAAESLEAEAKAVFGQPAGGATLALESAAERRVNSILVGTIEQGPVPMGPYVYVAKRPERAIVNVLCRCSPSLVDDFVATPTYELRPIESLEDKCPSLTKKLAATPPLDSILRWPRKP